MKLMDSNTPRVSVLKFVLDEKWLGIQPGSGFSFTEIDGVI